MRGIKSVEGRRQSIMSFTLSRNCIILEGDSFVIGIAYMH